MKDMRKQDEIIGIFDEIAEKTQDVKADEIAGWVRMSLEKEHKPTMALVSFNLNHGERFSMLKEHFGVEIPEEIRQMISGEPACLILDYQETPVLLNESDMTGSRILFGVPCEALKDYRIAVCDGIQSKEEWLELSNEMDEICLVVNATMAMNQMERTWLRDCAKDLFAAEELVLLITKLGQLNEEEDVLAVRGIVEDSLKRLELSPRVWEKEPDALEWMSCRLKEQSVKERHDRRVGKNAWNAMRRQMQYLIDSAGVDTAAIQSAMEQLKKQQDKLELAGRLASESILCNAMNRLKAQLCEGIRDYGRQMSGNIRKKVEASPLDQLDQLEDKINGYISGSWDYYLKSMSSRVDTEIEAIAEKLTRQMETDAGVLIADLDESARRTVYSALGLAVGSLEHEGNIGIASGFRLRGRNSLTEINVGTVTDRLRKETRNMMLLSIPLFFVNPLVSLGNVMAARAYGKLRTDQEMKDIRSEMAKKVEKVCYDNAELLVQQAELGFDDQIRTGSLNITSAYRNLVQQMEDSLAKLESSQQEKLALKEYLNHQMDRDISQML